MGGLVGLLLGVGLFLVWWSCWEDAGPVPGGRQEAWSARASDVLVAAGVDGVSPAAFAATCAGAGATVGLLVLAVSRSGPVAASFAVIAAGLPVAVVRARARARRAVLREHWPDVVDHLLSGVRAGLSLPEALTQLGDRGPEPLRPAFVAFGRHYRAGGRFGDSLDLLKELLADPVGDRVCEALRVTREVGGSDLGGLLRTLSAFLRDDARVRAELLARQSWTVNAARLAVAAPWLVLGVLATRPESVRPYNGAAGVAVLAGGAVTCLVAYRLMLRLGRLPEDERVLR